MNKKYISLNLMSSSGLSKKKGGLSDSPLLEYLELSGRVVMVNLREFSMIQTARCDMRAIGPPPRR